MTLHVALVSMPWASPYRPSIQLGALSAYVQSKRPSTELECFHYSLSVVDYLDYKVVKGLSDGQYSSWVAEAISAYFLYPQHQKKLLNFFKKEFDGDLQFIHNNILSPYEEFLVNLETVDWDKFDCIGFSVSLCQTFSTVLAAKKIRDITKEALLLLGGPAVTGLVGQSLLKEYPFIDFVVNGEGERPLISIIDSLEAENKNLTSIKGIISADSISANLHETAELADLNEIPTPNFDQYFKGLEKHTSSKELMQDIEIPIEGSRGCWWDRSRKDPKLSCQFCNLNLQWQGYREKSVQKQINELDFLSQKYNTSRFLFVDNILRFKNPEQLFQGIVDLKHPFQINLEARAHVSESLLKCMKNAGVESVQIGVESLSTQTLKKINKGTTAIQNIEAMKYMERVGIANPANIIYALPNMVEGEINETLGALDFVSAYFPLQPASFLLQYGSPYSALNEKNKIDQKNHRLWAQILPADVFENVFFAEKEMELNFSDRLLELFQILQDRLRIWREEYYAKKEFYQVDHLLSRIHHDSQFMIHDFRPAVPLCYELDELESNIYNFFEKRRSKESCYAAFQGIGPEKINSIVDVFYTNKLMFEENGVVLSLAI